jgi:hypothetical protein
VELPPLVERNFPVGRSLTWEDLQTIPDGEHWAYELVQGKLIVSPALRTAVTSRAF